MPVPTVPPLLATAMRPLPFLPLQLVVTALMRRICTRHPAIFERLGEHAGKSFGIVPTDLPFVFVLRPDPARPSLTVEGALPAGIDARISTPLAALFGMVEGTRDGDALMFSRELVIEGDMEAVLALRNAIEDAQIDLVAEICAGFGPLSGPLKLVVARLKETFSATDRPSAGASSWN